LNTGSSAITAQNPVSGMIGSSLNIPLNASVSDQIVMLTLDKYILLIMQDQLCMRKHKLRKFWVALYKISSLETATLDTVSYENEHFLLFIQPITKQYYQY
jgi:hypothetical protein